MNKDKIKAAFHEYLDEEESHSKTAKPDIKIVKQSPWLKILGVILIVFGLYFTASLLADPESSTGPSGKIYTPSTGSITSTAVKVTAETKNLEPGQYVWLAVDKPNIGLCWPKCPRIEPNSKFSTIIYEEGPEEPYQLSLYAVNKTTHDHWQEWLDQEKFGGLPMPPDPRRLDSVKLVLGKS